MSYAQRIAVTVTTAADGSATAYSGVLTGKLSQIRYVKTDFADGSTFTITSEATGETLWSELLDVVQRHCTRRLARQSMTRSRWRMIASRLSSPAAAIPRPGYFT